MTCKGCLCINETNDFYSCTVYRYYSCSQNPDYHPSSKREDIIKYVLLHIEDCPCSNCLIKGICEDPCKNYKEYYSEVSTEINTIKHRHTTKKRLKKI